MKVSFISKIYGGQLPEFYLMDFENFQKCRFSHFAFDNMHADVYEVELVLNCDKIINKIQMMLNLAYFS